MSIIEMTKTMIVDSKLPLDFLAEAADIKNSKVNQR